MKSAGWRAKEVKVCSSSANLGCGAPQIDTSNAHFGLLSPPACRFQSSRVPHNHIFMNRLDAPCIHHIGDHKSESNPDLAPGKRLKTHAHTSASGRPVLRPMLAGRRAQGRVRQVGPAAPGAHMVGWPTGDGHAKIYRTWARARDFASVQACPCDASMY